MDNPSTKSTTHMMCHWCPCKKSEPREGCLKRIHLPHPMEEIRDTGYWFCPLRDRAFGSRDETLTV